MLPHVDQFVTLYLPQLKQIRQSSVVEENTVVSHITEIINWDHSHCFVSADFIPQLVSATIVEVLYTLSTVEETASNLYRLLV